MRKVLLLLVLALGGCATMVLDGYVGKTPQEAVARYGPPTNVFDMGDGRRAFQWSMTATQAVPGTSYTTGSATMYGAPGAATISGQSQTFTNPGYVTQYQCLYTMYGKWDDNRKLWVFVGYEKPALACY